MSSDKHKLRIHLAGFSVLTLQVASWGIFISVRSCLLGVVLKGTTLRLLLSLVLDIYSVLSSYLIYIL
jgi:hypothetical protein